MARLWDAIRESAARGGAVITNPTADRRPRRATAEPAVESGGVG